MTTTITIVETESLSDAALDVAVAALDGHGGECVDRRWLDRGIAAQIEVEGGDRADLSGMLETRLPGADIIARPSSAPPPSVFIADMDSTMITVECIDELADFAGKKSEVSAVTEAAMRGELDFAEALRARIALLKGLDEGAIHACLAERVTPSPGAATLVQTLRARGIHTLLVSGGFTHFARPVGQRLGFEKVIANRLEIAGGRLTGQTIAPVIDADAKRAALVAATAKLNVAPQAAIAIGDGANDLPMVTLAGLGIAYRAKPALAARADARISQLTSLLYALGLGRERWSTPEGGG